MRKKIKIKNKVVSLAALYLPRRPGRGCPHPLAGKRSRILTHGRGQRARRGTRHLRVPPGEYDCTRPRAIENNVDTICAIMRDRDI